MNKDEYRVVDAYAVEPLQKEVNRLMKLGFRPIGGIEIQVNRAYQALVRYKENQDE